MQTRDDDLKIKVYDDSMVDVGIYPEDYVHISPLTDAQDGDIVIAQLNGAVLLRKYFIINKTVCLVPENVSYPTIELNDSDEFEVVGIVRKIVNLRKEAFSHA